MRRHLTLALTPLVMALALLLPASTLAAGAYTRSIEKNYCTNYPANVFKVLFTADGTTNANKLTIDSKGQSGSTGHWATQTKWHRVSTTFAAGHYGVLSLQRKFLGDAFAYNRVVFKLRAWHNSKLLWSRKLHSRSC